MELLENLHIISLKKKGKVVVPKVENKVLVLPLVDLRAKELSEMKVVQAKGAISR